MNLKLKRILVRFFLSPRWTTFLFIHLFFFWDWVLCYLTGQSGGAFSELLSHT